MIQTRRVADTRSSKNGIYDLIFEIIDEAPDKICKVVVNTADFLGFPWFHTSKELSELYVGRDKRTALSVVVDGIYSRIELIPKERSLESRAFRG